MNNNNDNNNKKPGFFDKIKGLFYKKKPVVNSDSIDQNAPATQPEAYDPNFKIAGIEDTQEMARVTDSINMPTEPQMTVAINDDAPIEVKPEPSEPVVTLPSEGFGNPAIQDPNQQQPVQFNDTQVESPSISIDVPAEEYGKLAFSPDEQPVPGLSEEYDARDHAADSIYGAPEQKTIELGDDGGVPIMEDPVATSEQPITYPSVDGPSVFNQQPQVPVINPQVGQPVQSEPSVSYPNIDGFQAAPQGVDNTQNQVPLSYPNDEVNPELNQGVSNQNNSNIRIVSSNPTMQSTVTPTTQVPITPVIPQQDNNGIRLVNPNPNQPQPNNGLIFPNTDPQGLGEQGDEDAGRNPKM